MALDKRTVRVAGVAILAIFLIGSGAFFALRTSGNSSTGAVAEPTGEATSGIESSPTPNTPDRNETQAADSTPDATADDGQSGIGSSPTLAPASSTPTNVSSTPTPAVPAATVTPVPPASTPTPLPLSPTPNARPVVVAVSPEDGSIGLPPAQAVFVITFSEPMDTTATESTILTSEACLGFSNFAWNPAGNVLTFTTCSSFLPGTEFNLTVRQAAMDRSGLEMEGDFQAGYRVLRESTVTLYSQPAFDGDVLRPGFLSIDPNPDVGSTEIVVSIQQRGNLSFDLSQLPAGTTEIVNAELSVFQKSHAAAAYGATGSLMVRSFSYGTLDQGDYEWTCALGVLCNFYQKNLSSSSADGWKIAVVTEWANEDWQQRTARGSRSQYQLRFANDAVNPAPANGSAAFQAGNVTNLNIGQLLQTNRRPALKITYLYP